MIRQLLDDFRRVVVLKPVFVAGWIGLLLFFSGGHSFAQTVTRGHSHNDYWQPHPLQDALNSGLCSVEADVFLVNGQLLVAHGRKEIQPSHTLASLYLEPLRQRVRDHGGHVYAEFGTNVSLTKPLAGTAPPVEFTLLIDLKTDSGPAYQALRELLSNYRDLLTTFSETGMVLGAVTVILTGNEPGQSMTNESVRLCALDGTFSQLASNPSVNLVPLVSGDWRMLFGKTPPEQLTDTQREQLRTLVVLAHKQGRRIRFWGAADYPAAWHVLFIEHVDLINTDHPSALSRFFRAQTKSP